MKKIANSLVLASFMLFGWTLGSFTIFFVTGNTTPMSEFVTVFVTATLASYLTRREYERG